MRSSYIQNNYGAILQSNVFAFLPHICVEFGILDGYSTLHIAKAVKDLNAFGHGGHVYAYDLWDDYPFNHGNINDVNAMLAREEVDEYVSIFSGDIWETVKEYKDTSICLLHVDISNDGDILRRVIELWHEKLTYGGVLLFEGGSIERDNVPWMLESKRKSIRDEIRENKTINKKYIYGTYDQFPSLSIFVRKA